MKSTERKILNKLKIMWVGKRPAFVLCYQLGAEETNQLMELLE